MNYKDFGLNLAIARESRNMSAYALSMMLGRSTSYISKVENGQINISLKMILEIAEVLEIDVRELFKPQNEK